MRQLLPSLLALGLLAGCASAPSQRNDSIDSSLTALDPRKGQKPEPLPTAAELKGQDIGGLTAQAAVDLQSILDSGVLDKIKKDPPKAAEADKTGPEELAGPPAPLTDVVVSQKPSEDTLVDLAHRMALLLRDKKVPDAVALAPIESMQPGVLADLDSSGSQLAPKLSPEDKQALLDARDRILAQPGAANDALARSLARLAPPPTLKILRSELCTRVEGFGRYTPIGQDSFIVGRPIRAIIYVELDGFAARPAHDGDPIQRGLSLSEQVSVELSQSLTLYTDPGGLLAWHQPSKTVTETSRNKRHDFYLIQTIELPARLTIGRYNLKVTVKDKTSTSEAEVILPINVVADGSAIVRGK